MVVVQSTAYGFCLVSSIGRTSFGATCITLSKLYPGGIERMTHRIILGVYCKERYANGEKGVGRGSVAVVCAFRGVSPCGTLQLSIELV